MQHQAIQFIPTEHLTFETVSAERKRFLALLKANKTASFLLDLSQVSLCDTAGLALLTEAKRLCAQAKQQCLIKNMPNTMKDLAIFCGVDNLLLGDLAND